MENWRVIPDYENYEASDLGNVRSLRFGKTKYMKSSINSTGYHTLVLIKDKKRKTFKVHQLVAMAFLGHIPNGYVLVIDHINSIKTDNRLSNLSLVTTRFNISKGVKMKTSKYTGVYWHKKANKWHVQARFNGKQKHLGLFESEYIAHLAYENFLKEI